MQQKLASFLLFLLHWNSFISIDGETTSPTTYGGPIGSVISAKGGLARKKINGKFKPISGKVRSDVDETILHNNDVQTLFRLCLLAQEGPKTSNQDLLKSFDHKVGVVTAARWVTTASNILCHYMQETQPSKELTFLIGKQLISYCKTYDFGHHTWVAWQF